jgi:hypothetical protein
MASTFTILQSLDFYLLGHLKILVNVGLVYNEEALHRRIVDACQTNRNYIGILSGCVDP